MERRALRVGIMSLNEMKARTIAIAQGRLKSAPGEPKVWFTSRKSLASVLSEDNPALLQAIRERELRF